MLSKQYRCVIFLAHNKGITMFNVQSVVTVKVNAHFRGMPVEISFTGDPDEVGKGLRKAEDEAKNSCFRLITKIIPEFDALYDACK